MNTAVISIAGTVGVALITWAIIGSMRWGGTEERLNQNSASITTIMSTMVEMKKDQAVSFAELKKEQVASNAEIKKDQVTTQALELAMLKLQNELMKSFRKQFVLRKDEGEDAS